MNKEDVKNKIIKMCNSRNIPIPNFNNYKELLKTVKLINNICPFCKEYVWHNTDIICTCEIRSFNP